MKQPPPAFCVLRSWACRGQSKAKITLEESDLHGESIGKVAGGIEEVADLNMPCLRLDD